MGTDIPEQWRSRAGWVLLALLAIRLLAMLVIPLNDTTEARYAEIARKMLETGDWVSLQQDYGVAFWAKPPLSTWLSAASMAVLGVSEFAVRLPSLLLSLLELALVAMMAKRRCGRDGALVAVLVLASSLLFFVSAGAVMTDPALAAAITLSMLAFWRATSEKSRFWGYLFFAGLGLGLLAKGPLALVLAAMPIGVWVLLQRKWVVLWKSLPWVGGMLLMLAIAVPWYALAESRTPGFLDYFIMGEHVHRFLDPGWKGDRYGFSHATALGMIWPYALAALLPWSLAAVFWLAQRRRNVRDLFARDGGGYLFYLALWCVMPLAFFSFSGNIIWPYSLPMLPAYALLAAELWCRDRRLASGSALPWLAVPSGVALLALCVLFAFWPERIGSSQKRLVEAWRAQAAGAASRLIYWRSRPVYSAMFYSAGRVQNMAEAGPALALLNARDSVDFIAVGSEQLQTLPAPIRENFAEVARFYNTSGAMLLLRKSPSQPNETDSP